MTRLTLPIAGLAALTAAALAASACPAPSPCGSVACATPFDTGHACRAITPNIDAALQCCDDHVGPPGEDIDANEQVVRCYAGAHGLEYPRHGEVRTKPLDRDPVLGHTYGYSWRVWSLRTDPCRVGSPRTEGSTIYIHVWWPGFARVFPFLNDESAECQPNTPSSPADE